MRGDSRPGEAHPHKPGAVWSLMKGPMVLSHASSTSLGEGALHSAPDPRCHSAPDPAAVAWGGHGGMVSLRLRHVKCGVGQVQRVTAVQTRAGAHEGPD